jgi:hypothetical protein
MSDIEVAPGVLATLTERDLAKFEVWADAMSRGRGPLEAGAEVNWSPAKVRRLLADPGIANFLSDIENMKDERIEHRMFQGADAGNATLIMAWLYNRRPDRWKDVKRIVTETHVTADHTVVVNIREAVGGLLRTHGVAALQPGGQLDEILDAEVISDSDTDT